MPRSYWWPFPAGTVLAPDTYLRVFWFQTATTTPQPGDFYTGTSPYGFLFGLGGEMLSGGEGAFGLFRSQSNNQMNDPTIVEDWVSWGSSGYEREPLAIQQGLWTAGRATPAIGVGTSIARDPSVVGLVALADEAWFVDATPTPLQPNAVGAIVQSYGAPCALPGHHLLGAPELRTTSLPLIGNAQFGFVVDKTTGIFGEYVLVAFATGSAPAGLPSVLPLHAGVGCLESIDTLHLLGLWLLPTQIIGTPIPLPLHGQPPALAGAELHAQALVFDLLPYSYPPYQGITNALRVVIGQ
jgi:hypothetical protein